jgi:hypothetical protein
MISAANRDIRRQRQLAELRRVQEVNSPIAQLDRVIAALEEQHLDGLRVVPPTFVPAILALNRLLPQGVSPLPGRGAMIRDTIDRCFDLQERLLDTSDDRLLGRPEG